MKNEILAGEAFNKRYHWTYLCVGLSVLLTYAMWLGSMWYYDAWYQDRFKYVAKVGSMGSIILICWAFLLVTRFRMVGRFVGGIDKAYQVHRVVGQAAFYLVLLHPLFLAIHLLPDWWSFLGFFWFSGDWVRTTGILALLGFAILIALSLWIEIARHVWKQTHNFFGVFLLLAVVHMVVADGEIKRFPLLTVWFSMWIAVAVFCYIYIRLLYRFLGPLYDYYVVATTELDKIIEIELAPTHPRREIHWEPGQFVWVNFLTDKLRSEPHPFTISSRPKSKTIRLSVKELGDWTSNLTKLETGVKAKVWGPYGRFGRPFIDNLGSREIVLIAGGIGVTPFISMLESDLFRSKGSRATYLIYSIEDPRDNYYDDRFTTLEKKIPHFHYRLFRSDLDGYLDIEKIQEIVGRLDDKVFLICGPGAMMEAIKLQLLDQNISLTQIFVEDFSAI